MSVRRLLRTVVLGALLAVIGLGLGLVFGWQDNDANAPLAFFLGVLAALAYQFVQSLQARRAARQPRAPREKEGPL